MLNFFMFASQSLVFMHIESSDLPLSYCQVTAGREEMLRMCPILPMERERERESQIQVGICYHQRVFPTVANTHWVFSTVANTHH